MLGGRIRTMTSIPYQMYIDGGWGDAERPRAIEVARLACDEGPWPRMSPRDRGRIIQQIADGLEAKKDRLRALLTAEAGCAQYLMSIQLDDPIRFMHGYADLAPKLETTEMLE